MRHLRASSFLYVALGLWGCEVTGLPTAEPIPVLQGLLISGEPRQLLRAAWSSPTQVPYEPTSRPVDESLVALWLVGPGGDSVRYDPTGLAGEFAAAAVVSPDETYRLSGTIASRPVTAQVSIPGTLVVSQPAADTLRYPSATSFPSIPFAWRAVSAASYQALLVHDDGTTHSGHVVRPGDFSGRAFDIVPDTTGELQIFAPSPGEPDTARLMILGYDRTAAAFFSSTTKGNVHGAFGLFGAAAKTEKVIVWE